MNDEELIKKWECVLDYTDKYLEPLKEEDRLKCAREMEEFEQWNLPHNTQVWFK